MKGGNWQKQRSRAWKASAHLGRQVGVGGSKPWQEGQGCSGCDDHFFDAGTRRYQQRMTMCSELGFLQDASFFGLLGRVGRLCRGYTGMGRQKVAR